MSKKESCPDNFSFTLSYFISSWIWIDYAGDIGPFQLAIVLTALSLGIILFWRENYGHTEPEEGTFLDGPGHPSSSYTFDFSPLFYFYFPLFFYYTSYFAHEAIRILWLQFCKGRFVEYENV